MPMNIPMTICGFVLKGWLQNPNMKRISVPFKRVLKRVLRKLVLLVVLKTPNPSPREKEKAKKRKGKERIPKGKLRTRVMTRPGKGKNDGKGNGSPKSKKNNAKGSGNQNQGDKGVCIFWPKGLYRRGNDCPLQAWRSSRLRGVCINLTS